MAKQTTKTPPAAPEQSGPENQAPQVEVAQVTDLGAAKTEQAQVHPESAALGDYPAVALMTIRHNGKIFAAEEIIPGLTSAQRKALLASGAARFP